MKLKALHPDRGAQVSLIIVGTLFAAAQAEAAPPDFIKVIHYAPPTNFFGGIAQQPRSDPGDNPMALAGPRIFEYRERYNYSHPSEISVSLGLACAYLGKGKVLHFLPATASSLKKDMEANYKDKFADQTPVLVGKINGLNSVSFTATRPPGPVEPYFLHFCWLQIETNIVLKITASSSDINIFRSETNSLQTLKIDKAPLLRMLEEQSR
jgi:hypothetical protein